MRSNLHQGQEIELCRVDQEHRMGPASPMNQLIKTTIFLQTSTYRNTRTSRQTWVTSRTRDNALKTSCITRFTLHYILFSDWCISKQENSISYHITWSTGYTSPTWKTIQSTSSIVTKFTLEDLNLSIYIFPHTYSHKISRYIMLLISHFSVFCFSSKCQKTLRMIDKLFKLSEEISHMAFYNWHLSWVHRHK